jgi:hypothetical protein
MLYWFVYSVCDLCESLLINFSIAETVIMKLGMYLKGVLHNPYHSMCIPPIVAIQRVSKVYPCCFVSLVNDVPMAVNTCNNRRIGRMCLSVFHYQC